MIFQTNGSPIALSTNSTLIRPNTVIPTPQIALFSHGDSMSNLYTTLWTPAQNYISVLGATIALNQSLAVGVFGRGINGISYDYAWGGEPYTNTMIQDAPLTVDPLRIIRPVISNYLIVFAGTNGLALGLHSVATEYANTVTYIQARIVAGWAATKIIMVLMLPRTGLNYTTQVTAFNTLVLADGSSLGYLKARTDLQPIGASGANLDTSLISDGTHPTVLGMTQIATAINNLGLS